MLSVDEFAEDKLNPLDNLEFIVTQNEWPYERLGNEEIVAAISGDWCDFHMRYFWIKDKNILQCSGQLSVRINDENYGKVLEGINLINECLDMGYFAIWNDDKTLMFRLSIIPSGNGADITSSCDLVTQTIMAEINRYYPVFQFIIWGGKNPKEAIEATMLETMGNA